MPHGLHFSYLTRLRQLTLLDGVEYGLQACLTPCAMRPEPDHSMAFELAFAPHPARLRRLGPYPGLLIAGLPMPLPQIITLTLISTLELALRILVSCAAQPIVSGSARPRLHAPGGLDAAAPCESAQAAA